MRDGTWHLANGILAPGTWQSDVRMFHCGGSSVGPGASLMADGNIILYAKGLSGGCTHMGLGIHAQGLGKGTWERGPQCHYGSPAQRPTEGLGM